MVVFVFVLGELAFLPVGGVGLCLDVSGVDVGEVFGFLGIANCLSRAGWVFAILSWRASC